MRLFSKWRVFSECVEHSNPLLYSHLQCRLNTMKTSVCIFYSSRARNWHQKLGSVIWVNFLSSIPGKSSLFRWSSVSPTRTSFLLSFFLLEVWVFCQTYWFHSCWFMCLRTWRLQYLSGNVSTFTNHDEGKPTNQKYKWKLSLCYCWCELVKSVTWMVYENGCLLNSKLHFWSHSKGSIPIRTQTYHSVWKNFSVPSEIY